MYCFNNTNWKKQNLTKLAGGMWVKMLQNTAVQVNAVGGHTGNQQGRRRRGQFASSSFIYLVIRNTKVQQLQHSQCLMSKTRFPLAPVTTFIRKVWLQGHDLVLLKNHCQQTQKNI